MFGKFGIKTLLTAASLAVLTAAGMGGASAAPWDHQRGHDRLVRHDRIEQRHRYVERTRIYDNLRVHRYRAFGEPYFVRGHYVIRTHDRFGHLVFVRIDPYTGAFLGEVRL